MADISSPPRRSWPKIDTAWLISILIVLAVALFTPQDLQATLGFLGKNLLTTGAFILFAVFMVAYLRATGAETLVGRAFQQGNESRMILLAALVGGLMPFCSCEVIPFIAALLAVGTPLSAVMAFWLSSPLMDPPMLAITAGGLGWDFAIAKTASAVGLGLFGGFAVKALGESTLLANPLRENTPGSCNSCCGSSPLTGKPVWRFWSEGPRVKTFRDTALENAVFLFKWLTLAYLVEALMIRHVPAEWVATASGGDGLGPIILGAFVGAPAYLNGYAAVPLISGLIEQGMSQGAAMSFMIAGGVSSIPAAMAVWALVKPKVFTVYVALGIIGAILSGLIWAAIV